MKKRDLALLLVLALLPLSLPATAQQVAPGSNFSVSYPFNTDGVPITGLRVHFYRRAGLSFTGASSTLGSIAHEDFGGVATSGVKSVAGGKSAQGNLTIPGVSAEAHTPAATSGVALGQQSIVQSKLPSPTNPPPPLAGLSVVSNQQSGSLSDFTIDDLQFTMLQISKERIPEQKARSYETLMADIDAAKRQFSQIKGLLSQTKDMAEQSIREILTGAQESLNSIVSSFLAPIPTPPPDLIQKKLDNMR